MAEKWSAVIRGILLRGNFIAGDAATVAANYETAGVLDDTNITFNGTQYSFLAVADCIVQAMSLIVGVIGENRDTEYRGWFRDHTNPIVSGDPIPTLGTFGGTRYGVISKVLDIDDGRELTWTAQRLVRIANETHSRRKLSLYQYYSDDVTIEHTRTNGVKAEIVAWSREQERAAIVADNDTADCPLPDKLIPALEYGTLAFIYRDTFNDAQAIKNWNLFRGELAEIAGKETAAIELPAKQ